MFFRPAHEILDEASDIIKFQQNNTISLIEFLKDKVIQQSQMLDITQKELQQYKEIKKLPKSSTPKSQSCNVTPTRTRQPITPIPPRRLSLPISTASPTIQLKQHEPHDCYSQQGYSSNHNISRNQAFSQSRTMMPPPIESYSASFSESNYPRASTPRVTWKQLHNTQSMSNDHPPQTPSNYPIPRQFQNTSDNFITPQRIPMKRDRRAWLGLNK
ncbi:13772_t:CDS:2 [Funneliformis geosporum]|uniref:13772_t:CDS:1 n=1 Tax=Funneliformis geosporum TaxID=1117311 RepID=A0A9W4SMD5_9GLOM|nr:13772_t:CDS:2 [Funneliformis geosporum]